LPEPRHKRPGVDRDRTLEPARPHPTPSAHRPRHDPTVTHRTSHDQRHSLPIVANGPNTGRGQPAAQTSYVWSAAELPAHPSRTFRVPILELHLGEALFGSRREPTPTAKTFRCRCSTRAWPKVLFATNLVPVPPPKPLEATRNSEMSHRGRHMSAALLAASTYTHARSTRSENDRRPSHGRSSVWPRGPTRLRPAPPVPTAITTARMGEALFGGPTHGVRTNALLRDEHLAWPPVWDGAS
jgi:hypothetical protein